jgi:FAD/FMN-containing dehydrogenase
MYNDPSQVMTPETDNRSDADPTSIMAPFFANQSCDPFQPRTRSCVIGTYSQYTINVTSASDVAAGMKFAEDHNVRLVIHNTGHDFAGKSSGAGSLSLWMHNLKEIEFVDWSDKHYSGKAIKMGAGVQGFEANAAAHNQGLQIVTGECPTVGLVGGYTQGGGHSALSSRHGMAADQALEYEVVVPSGETLIANRHENADLYWALSGGGGGTYGVVLSLISKAHLDVPTSGANLTFTSENVDKDVYYAAIETFISSLPASADAGVMSVFYFTSDSFMIAPLTGPGISVDELKEFLNPLMRTLEASNITYTSHFEQFDSYVEFYKAMFAPIPVVSLFAL